MNTARLNLIIPTKSMEQLKTDSEQAGCQKSEYVRRALSLASYVQHELEKNKDFKLSITNGRGEVEHHLGIF